MICAAVCISSPSRGIVSPSLTVVICVCSGRLGRRMSMSMLELFIADLVCANRSSPRGVVPGAEGSAPAAPALPPPPPPAAPGPSGLGPTPPLPLTGLVMGPNGSSNVVWLTL